LQIKSLEEDLRVQLFTRTDNHRLIPTEDGLRLYEKLIPIVQGVDGVLEEFLEDRKTENRNIIKIAGHNIVLSNILPKYIAQFKKENPDIKFKLCNNTKEEAVNKLINNKVDFVIYPTQENEKITPELIYKPFMDYKPVIIAHKNHAIFKKEGRVEMQDIQKYQLLLVDNLTLTTPMNNWISDYHLQSDFIFENATWEILKNMVKENIAISGFSKIYLNKEELSILKYKSIDHLFNKKLLFTIIIKKNSFLKEKASALIQLILSNKELK
jgi:DNA-binding transcriptional LysR family regulator